MPIPTNLDIADVSYNGTNIPVAGGASPTLQTKSKTYTPSTSQQTESVTADSGYDGLSAVNVTVNAMPIGTEGTPVATKGTVSNHSVSVTPSVTNSAGYISGGTKTGTAVSVSASELDSGTKSISSNGNNQDVVGYAAVDVNVPNSYSASDEGKVVSNGALVAQGSDTVTQNGTVDTTLINSLIVNVPTSGGGLLPSGFTQLQYVDTNNGAYIKTSYIPERYITIDTRFMAKSFGGSVYSAGSGTYQLILLPSSKHFYCKYFATGTAADISISTIAVNNSYSVYVNSEGMFLSSNQVKQSIYGNAIDGTDKYLYIGKRSGQSSYFNGYIYGIYISYMGRLIMTFIPCKRNSDNKVGMYDIIGGVFYTSDSATEFVAGATV